ncbi:MAG: cupin domain-containing protein [Sphingomonas fennica]
MPEDIWFTTARLSILLSQEGGPGGVSLIEHRMAQGFGVPLHIHDEEDEHFYMQDGEVELRIADETRRLMPGNAVRVPAGTVHAFRVLSPEARFLTITTGRFEAMVRSLGRPPESAGLPPQTEPTAEQAAMLVAACRLHGIRFVDPSLA